MKNKMKNNSDKFIWKKGDVSVELPGKESIDKNKSNPKKESLKQALSLLQKIVEGFDEDE
jgi:hypothetical protein